MPSLTMCIRISNKQPLWVLVLSANA
jgi:hypothetical protein